MTKISKKSAYPVKNPVVGDFFVGTDSENNNKTVSFGFEYAANLINRINGSLIINYMFKTDVNIPLAVLTQGHFLSQDNNTDINTVTKLYVNKTNFQEDDLSDLFLFIKENASDYYFKLQNSENLINAVYFNINSIVAYAEYFEFNIVIDKTNPSLTTLVDSNIYFFTFEIKSNITKTSDLENDGSDGIHPFITAEDLPEPIDVSGKENKSEKGQANGYAPLNALVKIASTYLDIVNDLVTGGATSLLSAEQGKQIQLQVDAINSILFSDNVNLDTVQEIVDAIESLQGYLDTILVNDLTTGGTTKALTAEMGKTLKGLIDSLTSVVSDLQTDVTAIDTRVTVLENYNPPPQTGWTGLPVAVWSGVGLIYNYVFPKYYLEGVEYPAISGSITLTAADPTNPRFTSIIADASGVNEVLGVAQENPPTPSLDPNTQLFVINVLINAGETTPANTSQALIYDEGTEWTTYASNGAITFNNTTDPLSNTYCINVLNSVHNSYMEFTAPEPQSIVEADGFKFWIRLTSAIGSNRGYTIAFYNNSTRVSNVINFIRPNGSGGNTPEFLETGIYKLRVIPYESLGFTQSTFNKIRITFVSSISVKFDYLSLITSGNGLGNSPDKKGFSKISTNNGLASATTSEDILNFIGENGIETKASGKTVYVSGKNLDTLWHKFAWASAGDVSLSGTTATSSAGVFESDMVGAKITIGAYDFIISSYSSASSVEVVSNPYGTVTGPNGSWGVYNKAVEITSTGLNLYGTTSNVAATIYSESTMILPNLVHTIGSLIGILPDSFQLTSSVPIVWRSDTLAIDSSRDVGIRRNAAGVLEIFDGITAGQYRDLVVRNVFGTTATDPAHYVPLAQMETLLDDKVDKIPGKGLSTEDYTTDDKTKVSYITITQAVNLDDIETRVNDLDAAVVLKGTWLATDGTFPGSGVAQAGWSYLITADGTVDGIEFKDGDRIIAVTDNASTSTYASNWYKADYTDKVNTVAGRTGNVVITSSDLSDFNSAVNALIATAISGKEDSSNKATTMSGNTTSNVVFLSAKAIYDWATALFQTIIPNIQSVTSSATVTPVSTNDEVIITAQAAGLTLANPTGTFAEGQPLIIRIKDNGTARAITFGSNYRAIGITLPITTVINKTMYIAIVYNNTDSKWDVIGIRQEA